MFSWKKTILALVVIANLFNFGLAQSATQNNNTTSSKNTDTATPTASTKGVNPTIGSYGGSNFDKVNLFNGNVSMSFPLASLSSRGGMSAGVVLSYNSKLWYVDKQETRVGGARNGSNDIAYVPIYNEYDDGQAQLAAGWTIGAGRMRARQSATYLKPAQSICFFNVPAGNVDPKPVKTLTTFSFTAPDGTEYDFRDTIYDGQPRELINCEPISRGKEFVSKDGTSATFISDTEVVDSFFTDQISAPNGPFGYVYLRDGTRFRIEGGLPIEQRDNNGNIVRYQYDGIRLSKVIDNMGREINVSYGEGALATITIKGFGGAIRTTTVRGIKLENILLPNERLSIAQLFPAEVVQLSTPNSRFNPRVVSEITLPDGHKWEFKYNSYGEVVYVKTPARGVVTYDMGPTPNSPKKGGYDEINNQIFRRVINRQTFPSDIGPIEGKVTYTDPSDPAQRDEVGDLTVEEEEVDPSNNSTITKTRHKFSGHPITGIKGGGILATGYRPWLEGKELVTQQLHKNSGSEMRVTVNKYEQQSGVGWIPGSTEISLSQPENNPRLVQVTSRLLDGTTKVSKVDYTYDEFNNVLTEQLHGFNNELIRRIERSYVTNLNGINYPSLNRQIAPTGDPNALDTHLRSLVKTEKIFGPVDNSSELILESQSSYEYDVYTGGLNASLQPATLPTNLHDPLFQGMQRTQRGNVTSITRGEGTAEESTIYSNYDVLGNVVAILGPLANQKTETDYSVASKFTFPTQTRQFVSGGVSGNRVLTSNRTYDFDTGLVITSSGFNGDTTTFQYNDQLDRLTREIRPSGFGETTYSYSAPGVYPNTVKVESTLDSGRNLTSFSDFDGFLRTIRQRRTDPGTGISTTTTEVISTTLYDAGGRVKRVTNPFRPDEPNATTNGYTTSAYDSLDRVETIETFTADGTPTGTVTTVYETNFVTVTDQAGKKRKSETDAAGRLVNVFEPDEQNNLNLVTTYKYDGRSNLEKVSQGEQTRLFTYDSLSRLTSATSPESGDNNSNGATLYEYDTASNLLRRTDPRGELTSYTYDSLNRLATKTYTNSTAEVTPPVSYFYDVAPNTLPTGATSPTGFNFQNTLGRATAVASPTTGDNTPTGLFHSYDIGGRITNSSQLLDGQHYTTNSLYNAASLPVGHTYPSGRTISHTYNIAGQITDIESNNQVISYGNRYTASGAFLYQFLGNNLAHQVQYNSRLQPTSISLGTSLSSTTSFSVWKQEYQYGHISLPSLVQSFDGNVPINTEANNGNISHIRIIPGFVDNQIATPIDQFFVYDELNRLQFAKEFVYSDNDDDDDDGGNGGGPCFLRLNQISPPPDPIVINPAGFGISVSQGQTSASETYRYNFTVPSNLEGNNYTLQFHTSIRGINIQSGNYKVFINDENIAFWEGTFNNSQVPNKHFFDGFAHSLPLNSFAGQGISLTVTLTMQLQGPNENPAFEGVSPQMFATIQVPCQPFSQRQPSINMSANPGVFVDPNKVGGQQVGLLYSTTLFTNHDLDHPEAFNPLALSIDNPHTGITLNLDNFTIDPRNSAFYTLNVEPNLADGTYPITVNAVAIVNGEIVTDSLTFEVTIGEDDGGPANITYKGKSDKKRKPKPTSNIIEPNPLAETSIGWEQLYSYDRYGNRHTVVGNNAQNLFISTAKNRITDFGYEYDLAGNLIADPNGKFYFYDVENRLVKVAQDNPSNVIAQYFYDGNGWRVKKIAQGVTTRFVYDQGGRLLAEYEGEPVPSLDAPTKEHIYGASGMLATVEADKINYHTPDHLGSPRILTDASGQVISRRDFFPFGEQMDASLGDRSSIQGYIPSNDFINQKFTGYYKDNESGLDFAKARYYATTNGRFISLDPIKISKTRLYDPQQLNLYAYVRNNPLKYTDSTGKDIRLDNENVKKLGIVEIVGTLTKNLRPSEQKNIAWEKRSDGSLHVKLKDPNAFTGKETTKAYQYLKAIIGLKTTVDYVVIPKNSKEVFTGKNSPNLSVTYNSLAGGNAGITQRGANGNFDVFVAQGGLKRGVSTVNNKGVVGVSSFPDYLVAAHEVLGEVTVQLADKPPGQSVDIENLFRKEQGVPLRTGNDHRQEYSNEPDENILEVKPDDNNQ